MIYLIFSGWCTTRVLDLLLEDLYQIDYIEQIVEKMVQVVKFIRSSPVLTDVYLNTSGFEMVDPGELSQLCTLQLSLTD